ncbi:TetR/AcrR family transcriptional regulator [Prescottella sp. R16]|uniref:TetR/AcrR family transcriptional regulator n=1 Tax=Prescottella sp. R16 TaxID=3064529 RepID=UPI00272EAAA9|nr:TetR/AcrR family transcriptional regulator [Prescottella sp. R16]
MSYVSVEQRRTDLIAAAIRVMSEAGLAATSTRAICAEAGMPQSVFHYCFASKDDLLRELTRQVIATQLDRVAGYAIPGADVEDAVRAALVTIWRHAVAEPGRQLALNELTVAAVRAADRSDLAAWQYRSYYEAAGTFLNRIAEAAEIEWGVPVPVLSRLIISSLDGLILGHLVDKRTESAEAAIGAFAKMIAGLAVAPVTVSDISTPRHEHPAQASNR